jgi:TonB-dependent receptor-like protein
VLGDFRVMSRDDSAGLSSNAQSTPIIAGQQRSFREVYLKGNISVHHGSNEFKAGADFDYASIHEQFAYAITDFTQFDPDTPANFNFVGHGLDREQALYVQDLMRLGRWTLSAGLRWDHYGLVIDRNTFSPRLGIAWYGRVPIWFFTGLMIEFFRLRRPKIFCSPALPQSARSIPRSCACRWNLHMGTSMRQASPSASWGTEVGPELLPSHIR